MNERYLKWDASAQRQLILIWVAQQLAITLPQLEERVAELCLLLPGLDAKMERLQVRWWEPLLLGGACFATALLLL